MKEELQQDKVAERNEETAHESEEAMKKDEKEYILEEGFAFRRNKEGRILREFPPPGHLRVIKDVMRRL